MNKLWKLSVAALVAAFIGLVLAHITTGIFFDICMWAWTVFGSLGTLGVFISIHQQVWRELH